jgi:exodeoxyribonuclease VII small subunit
MPSKQKRTIAVVEAELQAIVDWFASDDMQLEQATEQYEQAVRLLAELKELLSSVKNVITKLEPQAS